MIGAVPNIDFWRGTSTAGKEDAVDKSSSATVVRLGRVGDRSMGALAKGEITFVVDGKCAGGTGDLEARGGDCSAGALHS